jgi:hypothetical protein
MRKYFIGLTVAVVCMASVAYAAGYDFTLLNVENETTETATSLTSGYLIPMYDTDNGDADFLAATDIPGMGSGATNAEIDMAADLSGFFEDVTAANVLTTAECGKIMTLNSATEFATTLPAPLAGCKFKFIVKAAPSGASYTIVSTSGANVIHITVNELETDTGDDGPWDDDADTVTLVDGLASTGDFLDCVSDGTGWYCDGQTKLDGGVTSATT